MKEATNGSNKNELRVFEPQHVMLFNSIQPHFYLDDDEALI